MKYQLIETYTDSSGTHETYRSKKYTDKKDAVREKACSMVLRLRDYDKWVKTKWGYYRNRGVNYYDNRKIK